LHHSSLHSRSETKETSQPNEEQTNQQPRCSTQVVACLSRKSNRALIPTAIVPIQDKCGMFHPARALLDSGSEINFIIETLANKLQLQRKRQQFEVSGIGDVTAKLQFSVC